jgi:hypothetical protein
MAISSGVRQHSEYLAINGQTFLVEHGSAEQTATRRSSTRGPALSIFSRARAAIPQVKTQTINHAELNNAVLNKAD